MKEPEKSLVLNHRENIGKSSGNHQEMVDVGIAEEMFFLHLLSDLPETVEFTRSKLKKNCFSFTVKRINNVFDKLITPLIKNNERDIRAQGLDRHTTYEIFGPVQKRPTDFLGALCNNVFQQILIKFLVASWEDDAYTNIIEDFQICATCGNQCFY